MGTAVAKRSIWTVIARNPFAFFDAETFRAAVADRLAVYAARVGGTIVAPPPRADSGDIFRLELVGVPFPDGPGHATLGVCAYRAFGKLSVAVTVDHDRLFRSLDGQAGSRLYLHDYKFVRSYGPDRPPTVEEVEQALDAAEHARHAVARRNAEAAGYSSLGRIRVAIRQEHSHAADDEQETQGNEPAPIAHRRVELLEALAKERARPVQIRIRRRPPSENRDEDV